MKYQRVVGDERADMIRSIGQRYANGESIRTLSTNTGRSYGFVHRLLTEGGVTLRPRGGARRRRKG